MARIEVDGWPIVARGLFVRRPLWISRHLTPRRCFYVIILSALQARFELSEKQKGSFPFAIGKKIRLRNTWIRWCGLKSIGVDWLFTFGDVMWSMHSVNDFCTNLYIFSYSIFVCIRIWIYCNGFYGASGPNAIVFISNHNSKFTNNPDIPSNMGSVKCDQLYACT